MPSPPSVASSRALRRFTVVRALSWAVKIAAILLFLWLIVSVVGVS